MHFNVLSYLLFVQFLARDKGLKLNKTSLTLCRVAAIPLNMSYSLFYEAHFVILLLAFKPPLPGCTHRSQRTFNMPPPLSLYLTGSKSQSGVVGQDWQGSHFATSQTQRITEGSFFCRHRYERHILSCVR